MFSQLAEPLGERLQSREPVSIILVGHSLGSVILLDMISGFLRYHYAGFDPMVSRISVFTMGSPISLFSLASEGADPRLFARWVNFLHPQDPIAFPMSGLFPNTEDVKLRSLSLNRFALHSSYWKAGKVHRLIAEEIIRHREKGLAQPLPLGPLGEVPPEIFQPFHRGAAEAGFINHLADFEEVPFEKLIPGAKEIDICNVYARTWTKAKSDYFTSALGNPETTLRVCMLLPDSPSISGVSYQFSDMQPDELKKRIGETTELYLKILAEARKRHGGVTGRLQIYYSRNGINHSFYRCDDLICFVPRPVTSDPLALKPIPVLFFRRTPGGNDFFSWVVKDLNLLLKTKHDAVLHFDSTDQQQGGAGPRV